TAALYVADRRARRDIERHWDARRHLRPPRADRLRRAVRHSRDQRAGGIVVMPRSLDRAEIAREIHAKVLELARARGIRVASFADDEVIPETNLLDSAGIMELI